MRLYHFSNSDFNVLKPDFFGNNSFTKNDALFPCKRFFCYDTATPKENCFNFANFRYSIKIKDKYIYNLDRDVLGLKEKFSFDINRILNFLTKRYHGVEYTTSFKTYALFRPYRYFTKEALTCGIKWQ